VRAKVLECCELFIVAVVLIPGIPAHLAADADRQAGLRREESHWKGLGHLKSRKRRDYEGTGGRGASIADWTCPHF